MKTEVEQLLYYSVPGFFIEFFVLLFLFLIGKPPSFDTATVSFLIVATIPIGYIVYQAYVISPIYRGTWEKWFGGGDTNLQLINQMIEEKTSVLSDSFGKSVRESISPRYVLNFLIFSEETPETIDYSWRLINLVNGRAVGIFATILSCFIPPLYFLINLIQKLLTFSSVDIILDQIPTGLLYKYCLLILAYYALLGVFILVLKRKIQHIKESLINFNQGAIVSHQKKLDELVSGYVAFNAASKVSKLLASKKITGATHDLLRKTQQDLNEEKWDTAIKQAEELYKIASGI